MKEAAEGGQSCNMPPALAQVLSAGFQRKNQPQISLGLILLLFHCRIVILIGKKLCPVIHAANLHIAPVSYTHLDVYKRQAQTAGKSNLNAGKEQLNQ